jgi:RNA polymerase sigma-70 factor, ECF subfamily
MDDGDPPEGAQLRSLIEQISAGRAEALAELYDRTSPILYGLLLRMLRERESAEEALQDCYLRVWRRAECYTADKGSVIGWLIGIARYRGLDRLKSTATEHRTVDPLDDNQLSQLKAADLDPEDAAMTQEGMSRLRRCLDDLQSVQRRSVLMAYYGGYSHAELAREMSAPLGTVKAWVRRGLAKLRVCLERS